MGITAVELGIAHRISTKSQTRAKMVRRLEAQGLSSNKESTGAMRHVFGVMIFGN